MSAIMGHPVHLSLLTTLVVLVSEETIETFRFDCFLIFYKQTTALADKLHTHNITKPSQ